MVLSFLLAACSPSSEPVERPQDEVARPQDETEQSQDEAERSQDEAEQSQDEVEVLLTDRLDGTTSNYCIDIAGGRENVDTSKGLQAHTCYSYTGSLGTDQIFDSKAFANNTLRLPRYDVCATLASFDTGSAVGLAACDGGDAQQLKFSGTGTITSVKAPTMCLTAAESTKSGKSNTHQIKALTLEPCSDSAKARQTWRTRNKED